MTDMSLAVLQVTEVRETPGLLETSSVMTASSWLQTAMIGAGKTRALEYTVQYSTVQYSIYSTLKHLSSGISTPRPARLTTSSSFWISSPRSVRRSLLQTWTTSTLQVKESIQNISEFSEKYFDDEGPAMEQLWPTRSSSTLALTDPLEGESSIPLILTYFETDTYWYYYWFWIQYLYST